jgi:predicted ferric reductase
MKKIVFGFTLLTIAAWAFGLWITPPAPNARAVAHEAFYVTGTLAWGWMAIAIMIAARPAWLERVTGVPLDRLYAWHKWLGVAAIVLSVVHWFAKPLAAPIIAMMTLEPVPKIAHGGANVSGLAALWGVLRPVATESSIWLTVIAVLLGLAAFVRRIGYGTWFKTHRLFSIIFLLLTLHSIRLMDEADFMTPFGWINIAVTIIGAWYSIRVLFFGAGSGKTVNGTVESVESVGGVTSLRIKPEKKLDLKPGMFVFIKTGREQKHPFSVAGTDGKGGVELLIKALGDYTSETVPALKPGDPVKIEGGWGYFAPDFSDAKQVWAAAGIGIAPFCAWLKAADGKKLANVRLLWCVKSKKEEPLYERVVKLCQEAGVQLEVYESRGLRLDPATLFTDSRPEKLAVCAKPKLAEGIIAAWKKAGGSEAAVLRENFVWR